MTEAFWSRVDRSGGPDACWPWLAGSGRHYPKWEGTSAGRWVLAQRLGRRLRPDEMACHTCDNPPCCNPAHLFVGSNLDNVNDAIAKGRWPATNGTHWASRMPDRRPTGERHGSRTKPDRWPKGESHGCARLTEEQVLEIRRPGSGNLSDLANRFGVSKAAVSMARGRHTWRHLP